MAGTDPKADLHRYLRDAREILLWKLDGLSEYDARRPLTPTGTNLLGLVKHLTGVELLYLSYVFGRPFDPPGSWFGPDAEPNADMWATAEESREEIVEGYRRAWVRSDATIEALGLDATGQVPWRPDEQFTLHRVLVHLTAETHRHAGHADIVRELVDGAVGLREPGEDPARANENDVLDVAPGDRSWWEEYRNRVERAARAAGQR